MGFAYLGMGVGAAVVPWISSLLVYRFGWQAALRILGILVILISFPMAFFVKDAPANRRREEDTAAGPAAVQGAFKTFAFYLLALGTMCSIAPVNAAHQNLNLYLSLHH